MFSPEPPSSVFIAESVYYSSKSVKIGSGVCQAMEVMMFGGNGIIIAFGKPLTPSNGLENHTHIFDMRYSLEINPK